MKKLFVILALLLSLTWVAQAEKVTRERAEEMALTFFRSAQSAGISPASVPSFKMVMSSSAVSDALSSEEPAFYVFNNTSGPGFIIISADDAVKPVLGYSFENNFPEGRTLPPNLSAWLEGTAKGIIAVRKSGTEPAAVAREAWKSAGPGTPVKELETAEWNQDDPYNRLCPEIYGMLSVTGCVATSLAIVMRYHEWPERGTGTLPGYRTASFGQWVDGIELGHAYDWDNMPLQYYNERGVPVFNDTEAEAVAVASGDVAPSVILCGFCPPGRSPNILTRSSVKMTSRSSSISASLMKPSMCSRSTFRAVVWAWSMKPLASASISSAVFSL